MKHLSMLCLLGALSLAGCAPKGGDDSLLLSFEGRKVDIAPYFKDFPYSYFNISEDAGKLLFFKASETQTLQMIDIAPGADIRNASLVADIDFSKRNCWRPSWNAADGYVYWEGDESNDEIINYYRSRPGSGEVAKLTDVPYIYSSGFSPDGKSLAYVGRMGQNEQRLDELHVLDLETLTDRLVCTDQPDFRYTWGEICWQPERKGVVLLALRDMDRTFTNVLYVDLATGQSRVLTDPSKRGSLSGTAVLSGWYDADRVLFLSDQDGYANLYAHSLSSGKTKQLTFFQMDIDGAGYVTAGGRKYVIASMSNPVETRIVVLNPEDGSLVAEQSSPLALSLGAAKEDYALFVSGGTTTVFGIQKATVTPSGISLEPLMETPADIQKKLVHSTVERLSIPTFDTDPATGQQRLIHAYLFRPENPLPKDKSILLVESFYGGMNSYDSEYQIYADAGMYVLSAAPRGSDGFGRDFAALNDKDLGGGETLDMIYVTKYVSSLLGIPPARTGVFGMSHGGYETMRLMTFPGEVNGVQARFPFGFGMEAAGFCDIGWLFYHTNIPDWISLEAGDPVADSVKLADRSPIRHVDKITGPLLLIHGTSDNRVGFGGSEIMANALEALGKPYEFVIFEGQGHGYKGTANKKKFYDATLSFIENYVLSPQQ